MTTARATQVTARVVSNATPKSRITQVTARVVSVSLNRALVTQVAARVVSSNTPDIAAANRPQIFFAT